MPQDKKRRFIAEELQGDLFDKLRQEWTTVVEERETEEYIKSLNGKELVLDTTDDQTDEWL